MKLLIKLTFILFLLLIFSSCDIFNIDLNPFDGKTTDEKVIEIGTEGGTISIDDISITIPPGAFEQTAKIKVSQSTAEITVDDIVTPIYSIEGVPDNYSAPIDVKIKLNDTTSNQTYFVLQIESYIPSLDSIAASNIYFDAVISRDSIKGQIPAINSDITKATSTNIEANSTKSTGGFSWVIFGTSNKKDYITSNKHFKITYNSTKDKLNDITDLGQDLEIAYYKIQELGFSYAKRTTWPMTVLIEDLKGCHGLFTASRWSNNSDYLRFNRGSLSSQTDIKTTAIHEFFHFVQYLYDPRIAFNRAVFQSSQHWLNEACSVWSEELMVNSDYQSTVWRSHSLKPFEGLQAGSVGDAENHGYGMSAFVKYLVNYRGRKVLASIYEKILAGRHVVDAINNSTNSKLFMDCNFFFKQYSQGRIYADFGPGNLLSLLEDKFDIKSDSDTLKIFTANYKDLSAKVYQINLLNKNFDDDDSLEISIDQNLCDIYVFQHPANAEEIKIISEGQKLCVIPGLRIKDLMQKHKRLLVMVCNSNYVSNNYRPTDLDINLKIKVIHHKLTGMVVYARILGNEIWSCNPDTCINTYGELTSPYFYSGVIGESPNIGTWSFNNNFFTGTLDNIDPDNLTLNGTMKITFLENPRRANIDIERDQTHQDFYMGTCQDHIKFSINDIPWDGSGYSENGPCLSRMNITFEYVCSEGWSSDLLIPGNYSINVQLMKD